MIQPVQNTLHISQPQKPANTYKKAEQPLTQSFDLNNLPSYKYQVSFGQNDTESIRKYLKKRKLTLEREWVSYKALDSEDFKNIEGIQKGIKIFDNLSIQQIAFMAATLLEITLQRGCNNMCVHCYAKAMPPSYQKSDNKINKIDFEDFKSFCDGFKELNKRLGFNIFKESRNSYKTLFHDSDASKIFLQDQNGKIYDYLDLSRMVHETTDDIVIFDTAGWNIQDTKTQARMEKMVEKAINSDEYDFMEFNVSINPFNALYSRSLKHRLENNTEKEKKFRDIYTTRMANVLFTFSPLIDKKSKSSGENRLNFIARALPDETKEAYGYCVTDLSCLYKEVLHKLEKMYQEDLKKTHPKTIKNEKQIKENIEFLTKALNNAETNLGINGRLADIITNPQNDLYRYSKLSEYNDPATAAEEFNFGILDINGKYYVLNFYETYKTDIQLNYNNKNKKTADISPNLRKKTITKNILNKINK